MANIAIIGAGISGPAAAIALADAYHKVTVFERRTESELRSNGILGITDDNFQDLNSYGAHLELVQMPNYLTVYESGETSLSEYHYITWTDLHNSLVRTARSLAVQFRFDTPWDDSNIVTEKFDYIIHASGVGSAREFGSRAAYSGYVVIRGTASDKFASTAWTTVHGTDPITGRWLFNIGDTREGASFAFYVHRQFAESKTAYSSNPPEEAALLPDEFSPLVYAATEYQTAPISDWTLPAQITHHSAEATEFVIGDALGAMRPHTSMGANLGINEALAIPTLMTPTEMGIQFFANDKLIAQYTRHAQQREVELLTEREFQQKRGIELGEFHLG